MGGNVDASRLAGINIGRKILMVYAISGVCAGVGGIITTSRLMVDTPPPVRETNSSTASPQPWSVA